MYSSDPINITLLNIFIPTLRLKISHWDYVQFWPYKYHTPTGIMYSSDPINITLLLNISIPTFHRK